MITGTIYNAGKMLEMTQKWEQLEKIEKEVKTAQIDVAL